ncbi:MAG: paraslipin [Alphaproteobacteria bacterium]|nr:paraslipin [Alphaproteobacteria bacterium]
MPIFVIGFVLVLLVIMGIKIVPHQSAFIVEKLGRFDRKLDSGMSIIIPFIERVSYKHSLKEMAYDVHEQTAITRDNVAVHIDGVIYLKIINAIDASYGVDDPIYAATQLAQTTMRAEIGKMTLDQTFEEREKLNANIVLAINHAAETWGIQCMRYEIKNIDPPKTITLAMEKQVAAERQKRADILESEGSRQSQINLAEGIKQETILKAEGHQQQVLLAAEARKQDTVMQSEASKIDQINRAQGEAEAIYAVAEATARGIDIIAQSIQQQGGSEAVSMKIAEEYVQAFAKLAQNSTTMLLPSNASDVGGTVAQALAVFDTIKHQRTPASPDPAGGPWGEKR